MLRYRLLVLLSILIISCQAAVAPSLLTQPFALHETTPSPPASLTPPLLSPTLIPPVGEASATPSRSFPVRFHPDGPLIVGDQVSLEVIAPPGSNVDTSQVEVRLAGASEALATAKFSAAGIVQRDQATLPWAWDTRNLSPGDYQLVFTVRPSGPTWTQTVSLLPSSALPEREKGAHWASTESQCCTIYYITGTEAERDLRQLMRIADEQAQDASRRLGVSIKQKIPVVFLPRVLGQGGFTGSEIAVSYLDRNYMGDATAIVLHHEMIHWLDQRAAAGFRPTMLVEGLAVYLSGGHFKPEPLLPRAAALLAPSAGCASSSRAGVACSRPACGLDRYLPLAGLADQFYSQQHEIGYLEASALIEFMVQTWGWEQFRAFYNDIHLPPGGSQSAALDQALQKHYQIDLPELESRYKSALGSETLMPGLVEDVRTTVRYYDSVRRYQQLLDPSAYFENAWLPDVQEMRKRGIVADFMRHPDNDENVTFESLFTAADHAMRSGDYAQTELLLDAANMAMDAQERGDAQPLKTDPLTADYAAVVHILRAAGYQPQRIRIEKDRAWAWVQTPGLDLITFSLIRTSGGWAYGIEVLEERRSMAKLCSVQPLCSLQPVSLLLTIGD